MSAETGRDPILITWLTNIIKGLGLILEGEDGYMELELYAVSAEELLRRTGNRLPRTKLASEERASNELKSIIQGLSEVLNGVKTWNDMGLYTKRLKTLADEVGGTEEQIHILMIRFIKSVYTDIKNNPAGLDLEITAHQFQEKHDFLYAVSGIYDDDTYSEFIMEKVLKMYGENEQITEAFLNLLNLWHSHFGESSQGDQNDSDEDEWRDQGDSDEDDTGG